MVNPWIRSLGFSADSSFVFNLDKATEWLTGRRREYFGRATARRSTAALSAEAAEFDWSRDGKRLVYHTTDQAIRCS